MDINIRKAGVNDCKDVFGWRNDLVTRQMCFNSEELKYAEHEKWYLSSIVNPERFIYIAEDGNKKIGMVRADRINKSVAEISINMSPAERGKGYGAALIGLASKKILDENSLSFLIAKIKETNLASVKAFKKAGYEYLLDYIGDNANEKILVMCVINGKN